MYVNNRSWDLTHWSYTFTFCIISVCTSCLITLYKSIPVFCALSPSTSMFLFTHCVSSMINFYILIVYPRVIQFAFHINLN